MKTFVMEVAGEAWDGLTEFLRPYAPDPAAYERNNFRMTLR